MNGAKLMIREMGRRDWKRVSEIYTQGLERGIVTFETICLTYDDWDREHLPICRYVLLKRVKWLDGLQSVPYHQDQLIGAL